MYFKKLFNWSFNQILNTKGPCRGFGVFLSPGNYNLVKSNVLLKTTLREFYRRKSEYYSSAFFSSNKGWMNNTKPFAAENKCYKKSERLGAARKTLHKKGANILQDFTQTKQKIKLKVGSFVERENIWTIPNFLCFTRIVVTPYMGFLIVNQDFRFALYLLAFAGVTDWLDGLIARNFKSQSSKFGSFLDPMADKILMATLFLSLTYAELMPISLTIIIVARDIVLFGSGFYIRYLSLPKPITFSLYFDASHASAQLQPTFISKVNTLVQLCTAAATLSSPVFDFSYHPYLVYLWWLTGATTVASGLSYVFSKNTYRLLKDAKKRKNNV